MVPDTQDIIDTLRSNETYLKSRYFIKHIHLYGSFAKQSQHENSDVDLLYTTVQNGSMTLSRLRSFENYLSGLLKIEKIELVSKESINPVIEKNIEDYAIPVF
jgi:predicted nucleotidyltransferase